MKSGFKRTYSVEQKNWNFFFNIKGMRELDKSLQIYVFLYKKQIYLRQFNELFY